MHLSNSLTASFLAACALLSYSNAHSIQRNPLDYVTIIEEPVIHTPSHRATSSSSFELTFHLHEKTQFIRLTLEPNHDVLADGAKVHYLAPDGSVRRTEYIERTDHRIYKGQAWLQLHEGAEWTNVGWARIMVHQDGRKPLFEGAFLNQGDHHHIQTRTNYDQTGTAGDPVVDILGEEQMVLWRDSDIIGNEHMHTDLRRGLVEEASCMSDGLSFNSQPDHPVFAAMPKREESSFWGLSSAKSLFGRDIDGTTTGNGAGVNLASTIGNSAGCFTMKRIALVGVATDCTYTAALGNATAVRANVIKQISLASQQYETSFNITLGLKDLTISDLQCPSVASPAAPWNVGCSDGVAILDRLNLFSAWRGARGDNNAFWTLLSTCPSGAAVGLAWLGQACLNTATVNVNETVSSANVVVRTSTEWQVIAHETGHTFGAVHDCTSSTCADGFSVNAQKCCPLSSTACDAGQQFLMNPATGSGITAFSPCTVGNVCSAIGRNSVNTTCLSANKNIVTLSGSECGNGIVEAGEDCDCGGTSGCGSNKCCNPTTCKFTANSVCDPSNEDCCNNSCQFASNGTVCRASTGVCDPQEVCTGATGLCPTNINAPDGTTCGDTSQSLSCASGQCTSRNAQCQTLMGTLAGNSSTYACDAGGDCQVSCASPAFGANTCYVMQQNFLDGTSCSGGGRCSNGGCLGGTVGQEIALWVANNKSLVIGLSVGIGCVVIIAILVCAVGCCRGRNRSAVKGQRNPPPGFGPQPPMMWDQARNGWAIPQNDGTWSQRNRGRSLGDSSRSAGRSGRSNRTPAPQAPALRDGFDGVWGNDGRWQPRQPPAVRYA